jgi:group I intron endonuclease
MHVYLIVNDANGKYYVGKTIRRDLDGYFREQLCYALKGDTDKPYLYNAIRKHGAAKFRVHSLMSTLTTDAQLCEQEVFLISLFRSHDPEVGYNLTFGGQSGVPTEATRVKLRSWQLGRKFTVEHKRKIAEARQGTTRSLASRQAQGKSMKQHIAANGHNRLDTTHTEEAKRKIGDWKPTEEQKQKQRKAIRASWTSERRAAMSARVKRIRATQFWTSRTSK